MAPQPVLRSEPWKVLAGAVPDGRLCTPWRYATEIPAGDWAGVRFDDSGWRSGSAPFGQEAARQVRTTWTNSEIFLRKTIEFDGAGITSGSVIISHGGGAEIFLNGEKLFEVGGRVGRYFMHDVTEKLRATLRKGSNTLAVRAKRSSEGQFIDVGIIYY